MQVFLCVCWGGGGIGMIIVRVICYWSYDLIMQCICTCPEEVRHSSVIKPRTGVQIKFLSHAMLDTADSANLIQMMPSLSLAESAISSIALDIGSISIVLQFWA